MSFPSISQRGRDTPASPIRKLAPYAETAKANGIRVFHLNIGQPDIHTPIEFYKAVRQFSEKVLSYNPSNGIPQFLECLVDYYQKNGYNHIQKKDIVVTTGGSEAVIFSFMAVASPGEEIVTFEPFYPNYNGFAHMAGIDLIPVGTDPKDGYRLPPMEAIQEKITSKTKAILICSPNNPTGTVLTFNEMEIIEKIALKHNLFVLSDEVYREFTFDERHTSILSFPSLENQAILMDSISKRYSACGARIGCIVSKNSEVMETVLKFGQARLCPPTLEQIGACSLLKTGDKYFKAMLQEFKKRRDTLFRELMRIPGIHCIMPQGAFYLMVSFPVDDIEDFARWLLTDFNVNGETTMIAPGPGFYATPGKGKMEARIAYVLKIADLEKSIRVIKEGLDCYKRGH